MSATVLCHDLRAYVADLGGARAVPDDADLFATGAIKSMQLMELINCLEDTYGVRVEEQDVMSGKLRTVSTIAQLVIERGSAS